MRVWSCGLCYREESNAFAGSFRIRTESLGPDSTSRLTSFLANALIEILIRSYYSMFQDTRTEVLVLYTRLSL